MDTSSDSETATRIVEAAEELFAQHGYHGVSLRQITQAAKVNLAAVNYHYYDKQSLYVMILRRLLGSINRSRMELLEAAEAKANHGLVPLPEIMDALARPAFETGDAASARLLGRLLTERHPFTDDLILAEFQPAMARFGQVIRRHAPTLAPQDFLWRLSFIVGALHHSLATLHDMKALTQGICRSGDAEAALENYIAFAVAALTLK